MSFDAANEELEELADEKPGGTGWLEALSSKARRATLGPEELLSQLLKKLPSSGMDLPPALSQFEAVENVGAAVRGHWTQLAHVRRIPANPMSRRN